MTTHTLKSWPQFFNPILAGTRTSDMRLKTDRDFAIGDHMVLEEFDPFGGGYTGRKATVEITHIISNETPCALSSAVLDNDYCVLSIRML
ncbi:DUF3850 domain-containing protein [Rhizobium nepotum]|uniref:DUF3850 domain-containing protein n=1 Tax=Rhizobium nepotum TaxID=1035271 RepID=UPI003CF9CB3A